MKSDWNGHKLDPMAITRALAQLLKVAAIKAATRYAKRDECVKMLGPGLRNAIRTKVLADLMMEKKKILQVDNRPFGIYEILTVDWPAVNREKEARTTKEFYELVDSIIDGTLDAAKLSLAIGGGASRLKEFHDLQARYSEKLLAQTTKDIGNAEFYGKIAAYSRDASACALAVVAVAPVAAVGFGGVLTATVGAGFVSHASTYFETGSMEQANMSASTTVGALLLGRGIRFGATGTQQKALLVLLGSAKGGVDAYIGGQDARSVTKAIISGGLGAGMPLPDITAGNIMFALPANMLFGPVVDRAVGITAEVITDPSRILSL